ncbi:MAG TPA: hypothetical protein VGN26_15275 [Armatimonadota bacterium]|jgi:hypothetical protein
MLKCKRLGPWAAILAVFALATPSLMALGPQEREAEGVITQIDGNKRRAATITVKKKGPRDQVIVLSAGSNVKVLRNDKPDDLVNLKVGDAVKVVYRLGAQLSAAEIRIQESAAVAKLAKTPAQSTSGEVLRITPTEITVAPPRGAEPVKFALSPATLVMRNGESVKSSAILVGDRVSLEYVSGKVPAAKTIDARGRLVRRAAPPTGRKPVGPPPGPHGWPPPSDAAKPPPPPPVGGPGSPPGQPTEEPAPPTQPDTK